MTTKIVMLTSKLKPYRKINLIRSHKNDFYTETVNKTALSGDGHKRIIVEDEMSTLAYRHYRTI